MVDGINNAGIQGTNESLASDIEATIDQRWLGEAESLFMDFSVSARDLSNFIMETVNSGDFSPAHQSVLQMLIQQRGQAVTLLSQLLNADNQAKQAIIRNIS